MKKLLSGLIMVLVLAYAAVFAVSAVAVQGFEDINPAMPATKVTVSYPQLALFSAEVDTAITDLGGGVLLEKAEVLAPLIDSPVATWVLGWISTLFATSPTLGILLSILAGLVPILGPIANWTGNPRYNSAAILINKIAQLLVFTTDKNQPDVLSVTEMVGNKPSQWPKLIADKRKYFLFQ